MTKAVFDNVNAKTVTPPPPPPPPPAPTPNTDLLAMTNTAIATGQSLLTELTSIQTKLIALIKAGAK